MIYSWQSSPPHTPPPPPPPGLRPVPMPILLGIATRHGVTQSCVVGGSRAMHHHHTLARVMHHLAVAA